MPKRKNPFGDVAPIQLKTHVGFKQVATEEEMRNVYEKTRALLFQGANPHLKKIPGIFSMSGTDAGCNGHSTSPTACLNSGAPSTPKLEKCVSCVKHPASQQFVCSHCRRHACSEECLRLCYSCDMPYCHYCSVLRYDDEVKAVCFDCIPTNS